MIPEQLKFITNNWLLQGLLLVLLVLRIGDFTWMPERVLDFGIILYAPALILKSVERARLFKAATTKVMAAFLILTAVFLLAHSAAALMGHNLMAPDAFHLIAAFTLLIDISEHTFLKFYLNMHPALAFVSTFLGIIVVGTVLLMLPESTPNGIQFIDALFTSTSAVCVTGLSTLDTSKDFSYVGQAIIMFLIQVGGIGILTFTNLFGILFRGERSFKDLVFLTDLVSTDNLRGTVRSLAKIVGFVFAVEVVGAVLIHFFVPGRDWFFAGFHAVSAFCNAGFSTFSNSLYEPEVRYNYGLHLVVAWLIITGGIGYNVFFNVFAVLRFRAHRLLYRVTDLVGKPERPLVKWDINTTLVLRTTLILLLAGWVLFFIFEYNNTLADHGFFGKLVTAFFGSVTPRTAGFNTVDMTALLNPTIMITLLLMWIGASPGSTGGGIKTTVFAIATLNLINQIRGREQLVFRWQNIGHGAVSRVTTIISLSLIALGLGATIIVSLQPELPPLLVAFECVSAYATVGLTVGLTAKLSAGSKLVIIVLMFLGRVSFLTFLTALFATFSKRRPPGQLAFPENNIIVN